MGVGASIWAVVGLLLHPVETLFVIWHIVVPVIPLLLFIVPGVWRNLCPIATLSQYPRLFKLSSNQPAPPWLTLYGGRISIALFLLLVSTRKVILDHNATALAWLLLLLGLVAIIMGVRYRGKSGWCTSLCPVHPVERLYNQTPFIIVNDSHCQPCVGCTKQCYDATPNTAYIVSLYTRKNERSRSAEDLKLFASLLPGFILAFYIAPNPTDLSLTELGKMYTYFLLFCLAGVGLFHLLIRLFSMMPGKVTALHGAAALNIYYWFNAPILSELLPPTAEPLVVWTIRLVVATLSAVWILRSYQKEQLFLQTRAPRTV